MTEKSRESLLSAAFVKLADTLIDDFDVVDLLQTLVEECVRIFDTQAAGLMPASTGGELELVASTSEEAKLVEIMQLSAGRGPCIDCYRSGVAVAVSDLDGANEPWPEFRAEARAQGFRSVYAAPMRLRGAVIGTLNLLGTAATTLSQRDADGVQALADAATIGILQERLVRESGMVTEQLNRALTSRIFIEQAKGVLSETESVSMDEAFAMIRSYARSNNLQLQAVAESITNRSLKIGKFATKAPSSTTKPHPFVG